MKPQTWNDFFVFHFLNFLIYDEEDEDDYENLSFEKRNCYDDDDDYLLIQLNRMSHLYP